MKMKGQVFASLLINSKLPRLVVQGRLGGTRT